MFNTTFERDEINSGTQSMTGRCARWARRAAVVTTLAATLGTIGIGSSFAAGTTAQAATVTTMNTATTVALALPAAPAAPAAAVASRLSAFDATLLTLVNAKRAAVGAVALREVAGLDNLSATWSTRVVSLGRFGKVVANPDIAAQTLATAPTRGAFAQSVAKWYPQSVKAATVFALYAGYPVAVKNMTNKAYRFVGVRTVAAADGTSVATLTFTDNAIATQIVNPSAAASPTGALTSAVQAGASVQLRGRAADRDAAKALQVKITDTVGAKVTTMTTAVAGGLFAATVPLAGYGNHSICTTVLNQGTGANLSLGCTTARLGTLIGNAEMFRQVGSTITGSGWGYDPALPKTALKATVVLTGPSGTRTVALLANISRPDVARVHPVAGLTHGFAFTVPKLGKGVTTMCVTLSPASPVSVGLKLPCRSITVS